MSAERSHHLVKVWSERAKAAEAERDALRERLAAVEVLFTGGPDTVCRTVWREGWGFPAAPIECVSVPMDDLRAALGSPPLLPTLLAEHGTKVLRDVASKFRDEAAKAWGGGERWLTTGNHAAELAALWCEDRAAALTEGGEDRG